MHPKPELNQTINTTIQRLGIHGEGVGYWDGYTVFIDGALPGEVVQANLFEIKKKYGRGNLHTIENPSPNRANPPCPQFGKCGGCQLMHLDYNAQLEMKRQKVIDAFERIGKLENVNIAPCEPSPTPLAYRNKIQVPIRAGDQGIRIGFNARNSHDLVDVDYCHIHCNLGQHVYEIVTDTLKNSNLTAYDWKTKKGELRYLIIKTAVHTGQALVVFVTSSSASKELSFVANKIMHRCPEVKGVVQNLNSVPNNVVLGKEYCVLSGQDYIEEEICGYLFKVSPPSFFQVNPKQAENLYRKVVEFAELSGNESVLDAFCGVGTMSLILSKQAKSVTGVECVAEAIVDAKKNAQKNSVKNVSFVCDSAENYIQNIDNIDVVILNPPRKGCEFQLLKKVGELAPKKVIYVSCDPATLARDLAYLKEVGYSIKQAQPFDMFPQTAHVETVVCCTLNDPQKKP